MIVDCPVCGELLLYPDFCDNCGWEEGDSIEEDHEHDADQNFNSW